MIIFDIIGWIATSIAVVTFMPQTYKILKRKQAKSLSKLAFTWLSIGTTFWILFTPFVGSYQGYVTNSIIALLLIPIFYYIFKNKRLLFLVYSSILIGAIVTGSLFFILNLKISEIGKYIFVILATCGTVFWTIPQIIPIFKTKKIEDYSILMGILYITANALWALYWTGKIIHNNNDMGTIIISIFSSVGGVTVQLPILYIYLKYNYKK